MTLAEIVEAIRERIGTLSIVGRPLTDDERTEVDALCRMIDASSEPTTDPGEGRKLDEVTCPNGCGDTEATSGWGDDASG